MRWTRENDFDDLVQAVVQSFSWPLDQRDVFDFIKATIGQESRFKPTAIRQEPGGNASIGLMQVLLTTAQRNGFPGPEGSPDDLSGLFDPGANIYQGTKLIWELVGQLGPDWDAVASAYNGGIRPDIGMGVRATKTVMVCLARDTAGNCIRTFTAQPGQFGNQPYVDAVMDNLGYFRSLDPGPGGGGPPVPPLTAGEVASSQIVWVGLLALLGLGWLATR